MSLNALSEHYSNYFEPLYRDGYNANVVGKTLAHQMTIEEYRLNPVITSFGTEAGPQVGHIQEIEIPVTGPEGTILLRIYYPDDWSKGSPALPAYVNFHGGGWVIGKIGDDDAFIRHVVKRTGAIAVDVDYRLAPEFKYPTPLDDCWQAFLYVHKHAGELGIDNSKMALGGFSAGGHISAHLSQRARDAGVAGICFQLLVIPVCDASALDTNLQVSKDVKYNSWNEHHDCPFLSHARMHWFYKYFLPEPPTQELLQDPKLSPLLVKSVKNLPPALVVPADVDVLRDEGIAYGKRLAEEGTAWTQVWLARRVPHPFPHQYLATPVAIEFRELAIKRMQEAFDGQLLEKKVIIDV